MSDAQILAKLRADLAIAKTSLAEAAKESMRRCRDINCLRRTIELLESQTAAKTGLVTDNG